MVQRLKRRRQLAGPISAFFALSACGLNITCDGRGSAKEIRDIALKKLVARTMASRDPNDIRYNSVSDFLRRNPDCCRIRGPQANADKVSLADSTLIVAFRKKASGPAPYYIQRVQFGPCIE